MDQRIEEMTRYIEDQLCKDFPAFNVKKIDSKNEEEGWYYEISSEDISFGCVIQDFSLPRVMFYFFTEFDEEDIEYWKPRYTFRLLTTKNEKEYNHTLGVHKLIDILNKMPIKVVMWRYIDTFKKFRTDLKFITRMHNKAKFNDLEQELKSRRSL